MEENAPMNNTTMLGTYTLDGNVPVEPEIVLSNCQDTAMLGQLVSMFEGTPDIRFFLIHEVDESAIDLAADFFFLKDSGTGYSRTTTPCLTFCSTTPASTRPGPKKPSPLSIRMTAPTPLPRMQCTPNTWTCRPVIIFWSTWPRTVFSWMWIWPMPTPIRIPSS